MLNLQKTRGTALTRGGKQVEDVIVFNDFPTEKLVGKQYRRLTTFDRKEIDCDFKIVKVSGHVKWRHSKTENSGAKLKLARFHKNGKMLEEILLAQYVHKPDDDGWTKTEFRFVESDAAATSTYPFWNPGIPGTLCII